MRTIITVVFAAVLFLCGCDPKANSSSKPQSADDFLNQADVKKDTTNSVPTWAETRPENATEKVERLEKDLQALKRRVLDLEIQRYAFQSINLTPEQKGFQRLDAGFVTLLVTTESAEVYLDGFKIKLKVGNPTSGDLSAARLFCTTYKPSASTNAPPWESFRSITNSLSAKLPAGTWTTIEFVLAPATIEELRNASVSMEVDQVFLRDPSLRAR